MTGWQLRLGLVVTGLLVFGAARSGVHGRWWWMLCDAVMAVGYAFAVARAWRSERRR